MIRVWGLELRVHLIWGIWFGITGDVTLTVIHETPLARNVNRPEPVCRIWGSGVGVWGSRFRFQG